MTILCLLLISGFMLDLNLQDVKLLFERREGGENYDIYLFKRLNDKPIKLTSNPAYDGHPRWSPDGKKVLFISQRDGENRFYLIDLESMDLKPLEIPDRWAWIGRHEWSPDGKRILFSARDMLWGCGSECGLYLLNMSNGKIDRLIKGAFGPSAWISTRRILTFSAGKLHILDMKLGELERFPLPQGIMPIFRISPSPDSTRIVFDGTTPNPRSGGCHEIYLMDLTTGEVINLTNTLRIAEGSPCWTPDGRLIFFPREVGKDCWDIFIMTPEGETVGRLELEGKNFSPDVFDPNYIYSISPLIDLKRLMWGVIKRGRM